MSSSKRPKGAIVVRSAEAGRLVGFANRGTAEERRQAIKDGLKASEDGQTMSDVDRLREAADVCLTQNIGDPPPFDVALAALLRAMADDAKAVFDAGLALADTILGPQSVPGNTRSSYLPDSSHGPNATTDTYKNPADEYPREDGWGYG